MNYYEKHIGDYIRDTVSLTMMEDGAYGRLLDQLYQSERALPLDKDEIYRLARATNPIERKAVDYVLTKFFTATDEGYTQKRAQTVIEAYWDREPAQETKRENAKIRQQRTRDRRKSLFEQLRELGVTPEFNASMRHLEAELSRVTKQNNHAGHATVTRDDTLTQSPLPNPQSPNTSKPNPAPDDSPSLSAVGALCIAMRAAGVQAQPHDPRMMALAKQGVTPETLAAACLEAKKSKPLDRITPGYVLGILLRWSNEAAALNVAGAAQPRNTKPAGIAEQLEARKNRGTSPDIIDIN